MTSRIQQMLTLFATITALNSCDADRALAPDNPAFPTQGSATVGSTTPPAAPTNLVMTVLEDGTVGFSWNDNSSVEDGYELWYYINDCSGDDGSCYQWWLEFTLPPNTTSLRPGTWADFAMVRALKDGTSSSWTYAP